MKSKIKRPSDTSIHEAAHAVAAWAMGYEVSRMQLYDKHPKDYLGICVHRVPPKIKVNKKSCPIGASFVAVAGDIAEELWCKLKKDTMSSGDYESLVAMGISGKGAWLCREACKTLLQDSKKVVFLIANELEKKRKLDKKALDKLRKRFYIVGKEKQ